MTVEPTVPQQNYMTFDGENRMTAFSGGSAASYSYDGNGLRVEKSVSGGTTTVSIFSGSSVIAEYDNGAAPNSPTREYVYNGAGDTTGLLAMIAGCPSACTTTYYHQDHLSVRLTTDGTVGSPTYGQVLSQEGHYPYGEPWYQSGPGNKWFFTSYDRDSESGLDYALARYYDSRTGTFCSADPLAGSPEDPQSWNRYPYGRNDPIDITDPTGESWLSNLVEGLLWASVPFTWGATADLAAAYGYMNQSIELGDALVEGRPPEPISFGSVQVGSSWNGTPIMGGGDLASGIQGAFGLPTMAGIGGPIENLSPTNSTMNNCGNVNFFVRLGRHDWIGRHGSVGRYKINSTSAVIAPEQFGNYSNGTELAEDLPQDQLRGTVTISHLVQVGKHKVMRPYTFTFNNWADTIGNADQVEGQGANETFRQFLIRTHPHQVLLELPGLPFPYSGPATGTLSIGSNVGCPDQ